MDTKFEATSTVGTRMVERPYFWNDNRCPVPVKQKTWPWLTVYWDFSEVKSHWAWTNTSRFERLKATIPTGSHHPKGHSDIMGYDGSSCVGILQSVFNKWMNRGTARHQTSTCGLDLLCRYSSIYFHKPSTQLHSFIQYQDPNELLKIKSSSCVQSMQNFKQKFRVLLSLYPVGCEGQEFFPKETDLPVFPYNFSFACNCFIRQILAIAWMIN